MESDKKFSLRKILDDSKSLTILSFVIALVIWAAISLNEAPEVERVIEHVKVNVDDSVPKQLGYEAFGADDAYVDITVKGKRYLVGDNVLSADDISVTAVTTYVDTPGSYTLQLKATSKDANANYTIVAKSRDYVEVYFDTPKTAEIAVEPNVVCEDDKLIYSDDYMTEEPIASLEKVTVSGPATEVEKIKHIVATVTTKGNLKSTVTVPADLTILDTYGTELKYISVKGESAGITVTIPVYKLATMPVTVNFSNTPLYYMENPLTIVCAPTKSDFAADESKLDAMTSVSLGNVDFSTLLPGLNTITLDTSNIKDAIPMNKDEKFIVYVNTGDVKEASYTIPADDITLTSINKEYNVKLLTDKLDIKVIGPESVVSTLTNGSVIAEVSAPDSNLIAGKNVVTVTFKLKDNRCWVYGKYTAEVQAVAK